MHRSIVQAQAKRHLGSRSNSTLPLIHKANLIAYSLQHFSVGRSPHFHQPKTIECRLPFINEQANVKIPLFPHSVPGLFLIEQSKAGIFSQQRRHSKQKNTCQHESKHSFLYVYTRVVPRRIVFWKKKSEKWMKEIGERKEVKRFYKLWQARSFHSFTTTKFNTTNRIQRISKSEKED